MRKIEKWYQNIELDGKDLPSEYPNRKGSAFWNEGKWNNFIKPFLPKDPSDMTFVEIGCNVGLFLKMATDYGFKHVVGVEKEKDNCLMAEKYRDAKGYDYKVLNRTVGEDFDFDELPVADVFLMSNVHYYVPTNKFLLFLDRLKNKAVHCIVVSRDMRDKKHNHPLPEIDALRLYFKDWQQLGLIRTSSNMLKENSRPRKLHSLLFKSDLEREDIKDYIIRGHSYSKQQELLDIANGRIDTDLKSSNYYKYWKTRKVGDKIRPEDRWTEAQLLEFVRSRVKLARDIEENGQKEPILASLDKVGIDGGNRSAFLHKLDYKSIIVRKV